MGYKASVTTDFLLKQMQPDKKWLVKTPNGFKWAFSQFAQEVRMDNELNPLFPGQYQANFTITVPFIRDVIDSPANRRIINEVLLTQASICIPVLDNSTGILSLVAKVNIYEGISEWMTKLLSFVMVIQHHEVLENYKELAQRMEAKPLFWSHPASGIRHDVDEIVKVYDDLIVPFGKRKSNCTGEEIQKVAKLYLQGPPCVTTNYSDWGITTEFPLGVETSLLEVATNQNHPDYGSGLAFRLSLFAAKEDEGIRTALEMNKLIAKDIQSYGFGSFAYSHGLLRYYLFIPNILYDKGMLINFLASVMYKARKINTILKHAEWSEESVKRCLKQKLLNLSKIK